MYFDTRKYIHENIKTIIGTRKYIHEKIKNFIDTRKYIHDYNSSQYTIHEISYMSKTLVP